MFLPHELKSELDLISNRKNIKYKSQIQTKSTEKIRREAKKKKKETKRVKSKGKRGGRWNPEWQCYRTEQGHGNSRAFSRVRLRGITRLLVVRVQMLTECAQSLNISFLLRGDCNLRLSCCETSRGDERSCLTPASQNMHTEFLGSSWCISIAVVHRSPHPSFPRVCLSFPFSPVGLVPNPDRLWHTWVGVSVLSQSQ